MAGLRQINMPVTAHRAAEKGYNSCGKHPCMSALSWRRDQWSQYLRHSCLVSSGRHTRNSALDLPLGLVVSRARVIYIYTHARAIPQRDDFGKRARTCSARRLALSRRVGRGFRTSCSEASEQAYPSAETAPLLLPEFAEPMAGRASVWYHARVIFIYI